MMDETLPTPSQQRHSPLVGLPLFLFVATCWTTYSIGGAEYSIALLTILGAHEMGHFLQARRYGVPASLPFFIPIPAPPIGTMGAVIAMQPGVGDRKAIFDIAITGPLAGLVFALVFSVYGLQSSRIVDTTNVEAMHRLGEPLLFKWLAYMVVGRLPENLDILLSPVAFAGWVGVFITALNLFPIGQLDGGHILYALLRERAHPVSQLVLLGAAAGVVIGGYWGWTVMILLLMLMGPIHPPTANDEVPLGTARTFLGWASLLFVIIGFTPTPFDF
jgi:membrane-associated protease RseP (regulator of RpoE activity)